jgi:Fic family protein
MHSIAALLSPAAAPKIPRGTRLVKTNVLTTPSRKGQPNGPQVRPDAYREIFKAPTDQFDAKAAAEILGVHNYTAKQNLDKLVAAGVLAKSRGWWKDASTFYRLRKPAP